MTTSELCDYCWRFIGKGDSGRLCVECACSHLPALETVRFRNENPLEPDTNQ